MEGTEINKVRYTKLCCNRQPVEQRSYDMIKWVDIKHKQWYDPMCNKFVLTPVAQDNSCNKFYIEMTYGEQRPRLTTYDRSFLMKSDITCSAKPNLPEELSLWTIEQVV